MSGPATVNHRICLPAALTCAAAVMLIPANIIPVLTTDIAGRARTDTIFSGITGLWEQGLWPIAVIVFTASFMVPLLKLFGLTWLMWDVHRGRMQHPRGLTRLYGILDLIGRWSMLDVFLAAFLSGTVRFGALAHVQPQPGIIAFAAAVVLTMLATHAFDPRALWHPDPEKSRS